MLTNFNDFISTNYEITNDQIKNAFLACTDRTQDTIVLGPSKSGKSQVFRALSNFYKEKALTLAGSILSSRVVETETNEVFTLSQLIGKGFNDYAKQAFKNELRNKEIVQIYAAEKMQLESLRFIISTIDEVNVNKAKSIKIAFFINADFANSTMLLCFLKAFLHRQICIIDLPSKNPFLNSENEAGPVITDSSAQALLINKNKLLSLAGCTPSTTYTTQYQGLKTIGIPETLTLHLNKKVMFTRNVFSEHGELLASYGDVGIITGFTHPAELKLPIVELAKGKTVTVKPVSFKEYSVCSNSSGKRYRSLIAEALQIPLKPAYAVSKYEASVIQDIGVVELTETRIAI